MGYARIISGGPTGRYTVELDYGSSTRTLLLNATNTLVARLDNAIATQQVEVTKAEALEAAQVAKVQAAEAQLIASVAGGLPAGSSSADTAAWRFEVTRLTELRRTIEPLRQRLRKLQIERAQALRRAAYWQAFNPIETRDVWCADLTEDAPAGALVATADIPGESGLVVLAPGCRAWTSADGELTARELMSPAQVYLNAAILPGWQKFRPTYRWGTITAINYAGDTCNVNLADTRSSAQRLQVNRSTSLTGVPVVYSTCNAQAFVVGDRVVVEFIGQDWAAPRVIGFVDNPKACQVFPRISVVLRFENFGITNNPPRAWILETAFNTACGVLAATRFAPNSQTAPSASHRIRVASIGFAFSVPDSTIESSVSAGAVLWSASSSAYQANPSDRPPVGDSGTWLFLGPGGSGIHVRQQTIASSVQTLGFGYGASCVPAGFNTGGVFVSSAVTDVIPAQQMLTWLLSTSQLPAISATIGAVEREYQVVGEPSFTRDPFDAEQATWTLQYEPVPL